MKPTIEVITLIAKLSTGTIHQIVISDETANAIISILPKPLKALDTDLSQGISIEKETL